MNLSLDVIIRNFEKSFFIRFVKRKGLLEWFEERMGSQERERIMKIDNFFMRVLYERGIVIWGNDQKECEVI